MSDYAEFGYCEYCGGSGGDHKSGCPAYSREKAGECALCGGNIYAGDEIYCMDGIKYHCECFESEYGTEA